MSEYRVVWKREGLPRRIRVYQTRAAAQRLALVLQGCLEEVTGLDPSDYACCAGYECGCGGMSNADAWAERTAQIPSLIEGPFIESREVGEWLPA